MKLALAFLLGTLAGLTAHLALGYLWPVRVADDGYGVFV